MIALHIINTIILPFITVTLDVHITLTLCPTDIKPEMRATHLLFVQATGEKVAKLRIPVVGLAGFGELD